MAQLRILADPAFRERQAEFARYIGKLAEESKSRELLISGTRKELEEAIDPSTDDATAHGTPADETAVDMPATPAPAPAGPRWSRRGGPGRRSGPWNLFIRPAWTTALNAGEVKIIPSAAIDFEKHLLSLESGGNNYFMGGQAVLMDEVYWAAGYGDPQTMDPTRAAAISLWAAERRQKIIEWAKASDSENIRGAADRLEQLIPPAPAADTTNQPDPEDLKVTAADRTLFYRRALAAWQFLLAVNDRPALARLKELTDLERTPLPRVK